MTDKQDLIIIGAGLSGLYCALLLKEHYNIIILEARERFGGRILTEQGHDLGPSWVWPHQSNILALIDQLGLETFSQYTRGEALYDAPTGLQKFSAPPSAPAVRLKGGLSKLIQALVSKLPSDIIHTNTEVISITKEKKRLIVKTNSKQYESTYILSTLAPRLACEHISYLPELDETSQHQMLNTPTWMGHTAKCVVEFSSAFWRDEGLSGFVYSPLGPLGEIHDACTDNKAALFGFLQANAPTHDIEKEVKKQIERIFPDKSTFITNIYFIDWREEKFSSSLHDKKGLSAHPQYGLSLSHFDNQMFFIGTETAYDNGGYLEGAIISAKKIADRLMRS